MKILFLIWEFFKGKKSISEVKISENQFERIQLRNIYLAKYFEGEKDENHKVEILKSDLGHLKSKALYTGVLFQFNHKQALLDMGEEIRGTVIIGLKSLIECFEEIIHK